MRHILIYQTQGKDLRVYPDFYSQDLLAQKYRILFFYVLKYNRCPATFKFSQGTYYSKTFLDLNQNCYLKHKIDGCIKHELLLQRF